VTPAPQPRANPGTEANPRWDADSPNSVIDIGDVQAALAQFSLDCSG